MKTLQAFLEEDKDRLLGQLKDADRQMCVRQVGLELDRILFAYNDQDLSDQMRFHAQSMVRTAKAAADWIDSEGEAVVYGRTRYTGSEETPSRGKAKDWKKDRLFWIFLAAGIFALAVLAAWLFVISSTLEAQRRFAVPFLLIIPGAVFLFLAGRRMKTGGSVSAKGKEELYARSWPDPDRVWRSLLSSVLAMDESLKELEETQALLYHQERTGEAEDPDIPELDLLVDLLEETWSGGDDLSRETRSRIKFYLHRRGLELAAYSDAHADWFDRIAGGTPGTIRPAVVMEGIAVRKGLYAPEREA
jgi:hypothetical protein